MGSVEQKAADKCVHEYMKLYLVLNDFHVSLNIDVNLSKERGKYKTCIG